MDIITWPGPAPDPVCCVQVIPQLIARIDTPRPLIARLITSLLTELGKVHPQVSTLGQYPPSVQRSLP